MKKCIEQELKLSLSQREYEQLAALSDKQAAEQTNYYFYSEEMPKATMIRVREKSGAYILCAKTLAEHKNAIAVSTERECEITEDFAKAMIERGITVSEAQTLLSLDISRNLFCAGKLKTLRTAFNFLEWNLELDKNEYLNTVDYELECESSRIELLEKLISHLRYELGISASPSQPKSYRFFQKYFAGLKK